MVYSPELTRSDQPTRFQRLPIILSVIALMLIAGWVIAPLLPQHNPPVLGVSARVNLAEKPARPVVETTSLGHGVEPYLEQGFYMTGLGPAGTWEQWIIVDDGSEWTVGKLRMTRQALLNTIGALDSIGLDGQATLAGYRFRLANTPFVDNTPGRQAEVNHQTQVVTLADTAFTGYRGFVIYHELGHIVDHRTGRLLTSAIEGYDALEHTDTGGSTTVDGLWMRSQAQNKPAEAAADAFAAWVLVDYSGYDLPAFSSAPDTVNVPRLFDLVTASFQ